MAPVTTLSIMLDGAPVPVRLTLGALAEIENALGADSLTELARRLARPSAADLTRVLAALVRAGGNEVAAERLPDAPLDLREGIEVVGRLFGAALEGPLPGKPRPARGAGASGSPSGPDGTAGGPATSSTSTSAPSV